MVIGRSLALAAFALLALLATASPAATFVVTKEADDDGPCTLNDCALREAVLAANAAPDLDIIEIPGGHYQLTISGPFDENNSLWGDLDLRTDMELRGDPDQHTVIQNTLPRERVIEAFQANAVISHVTITGGDSLSGGGGLRSQRGSLELRDSTISGNLSDTDGGGFFSALNDVVIVDSTISDNATRFLGGGIFNNGSIVTPTSLTLINVTISGNSAGSGGGFFAFSRADRHLINSTIAGNEANLIDGVLLDSISSNPVRWTNTLLDGDCGFISSPDHVSLGGNIESPGATCVFSDPTDQMNVPDLLLGPLADNGGSTFTHALLPGSPAIDAGVANDCPATDQRGEPRPRDGDGDGIAACDVGAFEAPAAAVIPALGLLGRFLFTAFLVALGCSWLRRHHSG